MNSYDLPHLAQLEAESIFIIREVAAMHERPALLFSGGKDSIALVRLAQKAFYPAPIPFPFVHIDTGHNFAETIQFRDALVEQLGATLIVGSVQETIDSGRVQEERGHRASRNLLQTVTLLDTIERHRFDALFGGARRDEEKARAKERILSHRDDFGQWDPRNQRPELWRLFNGRKRPGEHFRVFPLSDWTEMDVWQYIAREELRVPEIYFAHRRPVFQRDGLWMADAPCLPRLEHEYVEERVVRFRTVGDITCTGAIESTAATLDEIVREVAAARVTERGVRADDRRSESAMEDRKKAGYF